MLRKSLLKLLLRRNWSRSYTSSASSTRKFSENGPGLREFMVVGKNLPKIGHENYDTYLNSVDFKGNDRKVRKSILI